MSHQPVIDGFEFASAGAAQQGVWPLTGFARLRELLASDAGEVGYALQGTRDARGRPSLRVSVRGTFQLRCQRCLEAMPFKVQAEELLVLAATQAEIDAEPAGASAPDRGVAGQEQRRVALLITVAVDCMGGDHGPHVTVPAALEFQARLADVDIVLVGLRDALEAELAARRAAAGPRLRVRHASEVVAMDEPPVQALRYKKDSSMRVAVNLVKNGEAHACVSAGNTGALMAISRFVLKTLPGIDRPAIATVLPNMRSTNTYVLDLGANVDCTADNLLQFGIMGAMLVAAVEHKERPLVGLLNIGVEDIKGNETVKQAAELLRASGLNFAGNVEGDDIYKGGLDVVVCDGFVGNVALKASEGVVQMMTSALREEFKRNPFTLLAALVSLPVLRAFRRRMDHRRYNAASLRGRRGIVVSSHGSAERSPFGRAPARAGGEVRNDVPQRISRRMTP